MTNTCGRCSKHSNTKLISGNTTQEDQVSFPVTKTQAFGDTAYSKFIPVLSVPGFVVIEKKSGAASGLLTRVMANSILSFWPVFVIAFVTALLAGIIIWILVSIIPNNATILYCT